MAEPTPRPRYRAVFVSPHLDDAVFSCGGLIAQLVEQGPVLVLNLFTRYLSNVKVRGVVLGESRYQEEADAAQFLGYESRSLGELDVSFRRSAYRQLGNIFRPPVSEDLQWLPELREKVFAELECLDFERIYVPLGIGWHVDHVLTHQVFDPWAGREGLHYYEDAPYCCIPHSTRYRLDEIAAYPYDPHDTSLTPGDELRAWWQASSAYAETALMKNLTPWLVRQGAVPVVSYYLYRLMALHRSIAENASGRMSLTPTHVTIDSQFECKVDAMALYTSQFKEFFASREDCVATLSAYAGRYAGADSRCERLWVRVTDDGA